MIGRRARRPVTAAEDRTLDGGLLGGRRSRSRIALLRVRPGFACRRFLRRPRRAGRSGSIHDRRRSSDQPHDARPASIGPGSGMGIARVGLSAAYDDDVAVAASPPEKEIRQALLRSLEASASPTTRLVEEFRVPRVHVRADIAVIGAELHAYEIKSEADSLRRLPAQVGGFGTVFDFCSLVVAPGHVDAALDIVPRGGASRWSALTNRPSPGFGPLGRIPRSTSRLRSACCGGKRSSALW